MTLKYIVEYRQVNINIGDCAFILLTEEEEGKKPVIKYSLMIDGGDGGDLRINNIRRVMERIEGKYNLGEGNFKLDAMVISHWDHDHYFGLLKLLEENLDKQEKADPTSTSPLQVSFLKYNGAGDPQSILYIPYPDSRDGWATIVGTDEFGRPSDPRRLRICKYLADMPKPDDILRPGKTPKPGIDIFMRKPKELDDKDTSELIGRDLFTGHRPLLADVLSATSPKALADAHRLSNPLADHPGLYCVAANNRFLKNSGTSDKYSKKGTTPTNRSSIICMVIWKDGKASHYLAGDADQDLESRVIDWTGLDPAKTADRVAIVKASHHGSVASTPITLCQTYKPKFSIFSSGDKHRHPTWEILLYVYSYYISRTGDRIDPKDGGIYNTYTTSFPYWIKKLDEGLFNNDDPLTKTTKWAKAYREKINNFFDASTADLNLVAKFTKDDMPSKDEAARADWIRKHVEDIILTRVSYINHSKYASLPSTSTDPSADTGVSSIMTMSDDKNDNIRVDSIDADVPLPLPSYIQTSKTPDPLTGPTPAKKSKPDPDPIIIKPPTPVVDDFISVNTGHFMPFPQTSKTPDPLTGPTPAKKSKPDPPTTPSPPTSRPPIPKSPTPSPRALTNIVNPSELSVNDDTDKKYFLMSSIVDPPSSNRGVYVPGAWDLFVSTLSYGFITLVDELGTTTKTVNLHESDEWQVWLASALAFASDDSQVQISATGSVTDAVLTIDYFSLTTATPDLTFSPARKVGPSSNPKFKPSTDFLRFDIADSSLNSSLSDICRLFDFSSDDIPFESDIDFELDKSSAVWFSPLLGNYTCALRFQASAVLDRNNTPDIFSFLSSIGDLGLWDDQIDRAKVTVVAKKKTKTASLISPRNDIYEQEFILSFSIDNLPISMTVVCGRDSYMLAICWKDGALDAAIKILDKITGSGTVGDLFKDVLGKISSTFEILRVLVEINRNSGDSTLSLSKINIDAQLKFKIGKAASEKKDVVVMLSFLWPNIIFRGSLYVPGTSDDSWTKLMPSYEPLLEVKPTIDPSKIASNLSLLDLIPGVTISTPPQGIPVLISRAVIEVDRNSLFLEGGLNAVPPPPGGAIPSISFDSLRMNFSYNWDTNTPSLWIAAVISLHPPTVGSNYKEPSEDENEDEDEDDDDVSMESPSFLYASVGYADKKWTLTGSLENINFGDLLIFFTEDEHSAVADVLGNVTIRSLVVNCEFGGKGEPTTFHFDGCIYIASLALDFAYNRDSNGWSIEAGLSAAGDCTVADVIQSICGGDSADFDIPDFIGDVKLNVQHDPSSPEVPQDSPVYLNCSKGSSKDSPLVFLFRLKLGKIQLSFVQISSQHSANPADVPAKRTTKRLLVFSLADFLPSFTIPVIGQLDSPIDGLEFVWVHDKSKAAGLTRAEVEEINSTVFSQQIGILFKETKASGAAAKTDIVLTTGCHFMLLVKDSGTITAALDYHFGGPKKAPVDKNKRSRSVKAPQSDPQADPNGDAGGGMSKAAIHKVIGPLSLSNIGIQYKDSKIIVVLDATITLGPIGLNLIGFGLGVNIASILSSGVDLSDFSVQLRGMAAALDQPPILLAGLFEDLSTETMELFAGGIAVSMNEYSFLALGSYGVVTTGSENFKTFFLFAQLHGPLVELEFGTINGVSLGFGYNSHLKYPTVDEILTFPLVKGISGASASAASSSSNVLTILSDDVFTKWVTPQNGSLWFAIGFEVLALETLDVRAVATIELDPYVSLGLFADAVCSLPPKSPRNVCFVYVELGITCSVDLRYGTFAVEGKLSPNSFVLHPSCHLLGGFALYYWFDPSPHAGDFVYTVGGYHPAYRPPSHYPRPERLTITWQLDSSIGITGESFFAITPKLCMGGGSLSVLFQTGALRAHLDAHAWFIMMWNPFHFAGDIAVSVGVGFHGKFLFWTYNIETDISALLHLEGPPFGGNVHVDFWLFGFDIYFGSHPSPPLPLSLDEFWDLLSRSSNQPNTGHDAGITLVVGPGSAQGKGVQVSPEAGQPWIVAAGQFKFNIQCRFALSSVKYNSESTWKDVYTSEVPVYLKPMHATQSVQSVLKLTIFDSEKQAVGGFTFLPLTKNVPSALWGQYDPANDPARGTSPDELLDGNNSTIKNMLTGMRVMPPGPKYPDDHIPPFNAHDAMFVEVIKDEKFPIGSPSPEAKAWLPTKTGREAAKKAWSSPAETAKQVAIGWAKCFKWADKLVGSAPTVLVDKFEDVYLDIPMITSSI